MDERERMTLEHMFLAFMDTREWGGVGIFRTKSQISIPNSSSIEMLGVLCGLAPNPNMPP